MVMDRKPASSWEGCFLAHGIDELYMDKWLHNYKIDGEDQKKAIEDIKSCVGTTRPIVMLGNFGGGKTHIASAIVKHTLMKRQSAYFYTLSSLFRDYRTSLGNPEFNESQFFDRIFNCEVLVIDECNIRSDSEAENRIIQEIVDRRYSKQKQTIFCANMNIDEFTEMLTERLIDRLRGQKALIVTFKWGSYRV